MSAAFREMSRIFGIYQINIVTTGYLLCNDLGGISPK